MSIFERYLTVWVALVMVAGMLIGLVGPGLVALVASAEVASINLVVALLIWAMVYPMMVGVDFRAVGGVARQPKGLILTLVVNWLIKPFIMALLA
ncbi:MAG: arsenical-resistance protein, partial [Pseudomonadota bacterium]